MKACLIQCEGRCKQQVWVLAPRLDIDGFAGVYCCPVCEDVKIKQLIKPFDAIITITKEGKPGELTTLVSEAQQGQSFSIEQFYSSGRGDNQSGEGTPTKSEKPPSISNVAPGARTSEYEKEVCKYFGIASDQ